MKSFFQYDDPRDRLELAWGQSLRDEPEDDDLLRPSVRRSLDLPSRPVPHTSSGAVAAGRASAPPDARGLGGVRDSATEAPSPKEQR